MKILKSIKRSQITITLYKLLFWFVGKMPSNKRLIIFESYLGKQYSCNPRAIYEYLLKHRYDYKMIWSVDPRYVKYFKEKSIPFVKRFSVKWLFLMARAKYWVSNSRLPLWIPKPNHTIYLQTWHGTPLKKLAIDINEVHMPGVTTKHYKNEFIKESSRWDYLISPNAYSTEIFKRAFKFNKTVLETGYPRNDYLFENNNSKFIISLKKKMDIPLDKKVLLYAPTWRDDLYHSIGHYKFQLPLDLNLMKEKLSEEFVIILRMHYLVTEDLDIEPYKGFIYDFTDYEDIRDLYLVADVLITDYSSVFFDFANLKRPIIFFTFDLDRYRDKLRGFYLEFEKVAPGPIVKCTEELIAEINELNNKGFQIPKSADDFFKRFCYLESGESSKKVIESIFVERYIK